MFVLKVAGAVVLGFIVVGMVAGRDKSGPASGTGLVTKASVEGCQVTFANFNKLHSGMGYANAVRTLGCDGREMSRVEIEGIPSTVMYMWDGNEGWGANMNATFSDDSLTTKAQFGLK